MIDSVLVSFDDSKPDTAVLVVGRKRMNQSVEIINAFSGKEAIELYNKIITQRTKGDGVG